MCVDVELRGMTVSKQPRWSYYVSEWDRVVVVPCVIIFLLALLHPLASIQNGHPHLPFQAKSPRSAPPYSRIQCGFKAIMTC